MAIYAGTVRQEFGLSYWNSAGGALEHAYDGSLSPRLIEGTIPPRNGRAIALETNQFANSKLAVMTSRRHTGFLPLKGLSNSHISKLAAASKHI